MIKVQFRGMFVAMLGLAASLLMPSAAAGQSTYLVDTGAGGTSSIGTLALFAAGSTTCAPQPQCAQNFQFLAAQFTLTQAATIDAIEAWVRPNSGGSMDVKIREDVLGLPSTNAPPLFSPNSIYSKRYSNLSGFTGTAQWLAFQQYGAVLAAGTYWVTFEPVQGSGLNYNMPGGVPNPQARYAFFSNGNPGYVALNPVTTASHRLGIRIQGTNFPGTAFGTATRVIMKGSTGPGGSFDYDFIQAGARDFVRNGVQGPALTSNYIFVIPGGEVHGRGKLFANGLSAGAYGFMSQCFVLPLCSSGQEGGARGVAYRTLINMSDVPKTFQVNAILDGNLAQQGRHAFAGVYVFDSTAFSDTVLNSGRTPEEFLLRRDGLTRLAGGSGLSLATLFPSGLLASTVQLVNAPFNTVLHLPLTTALITVNPQQMITVLFDVAVYAPNGGSVNFGDTLAPAANFITDASGNPVPQIVAVGPSFAPTPAATSLALTPATGTTPLGTPYSVIAIATANGQPVADALVTFSIGSGPNAGLSQQVHTDTNGEATLTYSGSVLGTDAIQASVSALQSNAVANTWTVGVLDHIVISPPSATISAGGSQTYTVEAFDGFDNSRGDVTATTTFSIAPDGSCTGATCTATAPGSHTVTGSSGGQTAQATLTVTGTTGYTFQGFFAPIDNAPVVNVAKAGSGVPVKFSLGGNQGLNIFSPGYPASQPVACDTSVPSDTIEETATAGASGLTYDSVADQYVYVWKTEKAWANTCRQLNVKLSDGTNHVASFRFTK